MMKWIITLIFILSCTPAFPQNTESFSNYMRRLSPATVPLSGTEPTIVLQNGIAKQTPSGSFAGGVDYTVNGGNTSRADVNRWVDNWVEAPEIGVDCTNTKDSTTAIQNFFTSFPNGHLKFPQGCHLFTTQTINIPSTSNAMIGGDNLWGGTQNTANSSVWTWRGTNGGTSCSINYASCVYVVNFQSVDHAVVRDMQFVSGGGANCPDGFLKFNGPFVNALSTSGHVIGNSFDNSACANYNFIGIAIGPASPSNNENFWVLDNNVICSSTGSHLAAVYDGVTNGTATVTSATANFQSGWVGQRIRIAYASGFFDTIITGFTNSTTVTVAASVPFSQSNVNLIVGDFQGIGILTGLNSNQNHEFVDRYTYSNCDVAIYANNVNIRKVDGGFSDIGVFLVGSFANAVDGYASESDDIAIMSNSENALISNSAFINTNPTLSFGFIVANNGTYVNNSWGGPTLFGTNSTAIQGAYLMEPTCTENLIGGLGYTDGTYTANLKDGIGINHADSSTVTIFGGTVTSVTLHAFGGAGIVVRAGAIVSAPASSLGGSGSGFSVQIACARNNASGNASYHGFGNNWAGMAYTTTGLGNLNNSTQIFDIGITSLPAQNVLLGSLSVGNGTTCAAGTVSIATLTIASGIVTHC